MEDFQLVPIQNIDAVAVFTGGGVDAILKSIEERVMSFVPDVSTARGRKDIASIAYKVAQSKTYIDGLGKDLVSDWKAKAKKVDDERKKARDFLDGLKDRVREPLNEWEKAEEERVSTHEKNLQYMDVLVETITGSGEPKNSQQLKAQLAELEAIEIGEHWEEFYGKAESVKEKNMTTLQAAIARQEQYEAEQEELAKLRREAEERKAKEEAERIEKERKEREDRIAKEAAEKAIKEAEAKAERERLAAEQRERELKEAAENAERQRILAEARAKAEQEAAVKDAERKAQEEADRKERERLAKEAADKAEAERLAKNKTHRQKICKEILSDLQANGVDPVVSVKVLDLIDSGKIRNVSVSY